MTTETHSPDPEVEAAFRWLLSYLPTGGWESRRAAVERHIEAMVTPRAAPPPDAEYHRLIGPAAQTLGRSAGRELAAAALEAFRARRPGRGAACNG